MILLSFIIPISISYSCIANASFAEPLDGMKLRLIEFITRHGERTPQANLLNLSTTDNWTCDEEDSLAGYEDAGPETHYRRYKTILDPRFVILRPNCRIGDLTLNGMQQHFALGQKAKQHFIDKLNFLPQNLHPKYFTFISSPFDRCFKSAQSFLAGLYEPNSDNEVLNIETGTDSLSSLYPDPSQCQELNDMKAKFYSLNTTNDYLHTTMEKLIILKEKLNLTETHDNLVSMCDWAVSYKCGQTGTSCPDYITDDVFDTCAKALSYYHYKLYELNPDVPFSHTMRHMFQIADQVIGQSKPIKFVLISAHDSTIAALLSFLGVQKDYLPPYASSCYAEFWEDESGELSIRFVLNGEPIVIPHFENSLIKFDKFRSWSDPRTQHCLDIPL